MLLRVGPLPVASLAASAEFTTRVLPKVLAALATPLPSLKAEGLLLVFSPAQPRHRAWRLAVIQELARVYAPLRINAVESDDEAAITAAAAYLDTAAAITGQYLPLDGKGAGHVVTSPA